jgi:outer membrane protein OmpA-like peptidoglycan-associated protein
MKTKYSPKRLSILALLVSAGLTACATDEALFAEYDRLCRSDVCLAAAAEVMYEVDRTSLEWEPAVYFGYDKSNIAESEAFRLDKNIQAMLDHPELNINIQAFTDENASHRYNIGLSDRRRQSVENYLLENGIDASRIIASIAGEMLPIHAGDSVQDHAVNRRVEMMLIDTRGVPLSFKVTLPDGGQQDFVPPYPDRKIYNQ